MIKFSSMQEDNLYRFFESLKKITVENGMKCPIEISELSREIGIKEKEAYIIAEILFKQNKIEY